jgi:RsiW-degrading membrane proteinase PrsW (M82 family)
VPGTAAVEFGGVAIVDLAVLVAISLVLVFPERWCLQWIDRRLDGKPVDWFVGMFPVGALIVALVAIVPAIAVTREPWTVAVSATILEITYLIWVTQPIRRRQNA